MSSLIRKTSRPLVILTVALFFCSCSEPEITREAPIINEVKAGSTFLIILPEDHRTGYLWQLKDEYDKTCIENSSAVWHGNEKGIYFHFKTRAAGQVNLTFINRRYTDTSNVKSFIVKILGS